MCSGAALLPVLATAFAERSSCISCSAYYTLCTGGGSGVLPALAAAAGPVPALPALQRRAAPAGERGGGQGQGVCADRHQCPAQAVRPPQAHLRRAAPRHRQGPCGGRRLQGDPALLQSSIPLKHFSGRHNQQLLQVRSQDARLAKRLRRSAVWVQDCGQYFPPGLFDDGRPGRGRGTLPVGALHSCFSRLIGPATAASTLTSASSLLAQGSYRPIKHASHHTLAELKP